MFKKSKKIIVLLLSVVLIFSLNVSVLASDVINENTSHINATLKSVECIKDQLGFSGIDFEELSYSNSIFAYDYTDGGIVYNSEFIPLLYRDELVAWVIKTEDSIYQFSTALVDEINEILVNNMQFAIIYDIDTSYLYDGEYLYPLAEVSLLVEDRVELENAQVLEAFEVLLGCINNSTDLQYTSTINNARTPIYYSCNVSFVTQEPPSNMCWAASAACIANYLNGTNLTAADVAKSWYDTTIYSEYNYGLTIGLQDDVLEEYGIDYIYRNQVPSDGIIFDNIYNGYPVQATFEWSNGYHDVVIYGINTIGGYIYIMDPEFGFCEATYELYGGYTYVSGYSGVTLTLDRATCKYWTLQS